MRKLLRRLRGILGMALSWAIPWGVAIGTTGGLLAYFIVRLPPGVSRIVVALQAALGNGISGAVLGFLTGGVFSVVLISAEHQRSLPDLKESRFALWGAVAGAASAGVMILPALTLGQIPALAWAVLMAVGTSLGVVSSVSSLRIAQAGLELESGDPTPDERSLPGDPEGPITLREEGVSV